MITTYVQRGLFRNNFLNFGLFFETTLVAFLAYCPGFDKGLKTYPLL